MASHPYYDDGLLDEYENGDTAMVWDIHITDSIANPKMRSAVKAGHGVR